MSVACSYAAHLRRDEDGLTNNGFESVDHTCDEMRMPRQAPTKEVQCAAHLRRDEDGLANKEIDHT